MPRCGLAGAAVLLGAMLAAPSGMRATAAAPPGWAALVEYDSYGGRYPDLPVGYINSVRILNALARRGWPADHILLLRDSPDPAVLRRALGWLAERAGPADLAVLYVAGEYQFFAAELSWDTAFPRLWKEIPTRRRVLIVETCFAQRLTAAAADGPGMGLPAVGRDELDWWGLREDGRVIRGGSFTYYLADALEAQPAEAPPDFPAAFAHALTAAREYFRTVVAVLPAALDSFHSRDSYPERLATFPNPRLVQAPPRVSDGP